MRTFLTNCRVVDGTGAPAREKQVLVLDDKTIAWVGNAGDPGCPALTEGDRQVDMQGYTVMPGLINCHVHLGLKLPFPEKRADAFTHGYRSLLNYRRALEALWAGTTTLRVIGEPYGTDLDTRNAINKGMLFGPRLVCAGSAIIATGGHGHNSVGCVECDGVAGFRKAARDQLKAGADYLKIIITGGIGTPGEQPTDKQMTDDEIAAVVEVARMAGKYVASHTGGDGPVRDAVRLGVECIEHGYSFSDQAAEEMAAAGTYLVATLAVTHGLEYMKAHGVQDWMLDKTRMAAEEHLASAKRAVRAGVTMATGTDLLASDPIDGTTASIREVELLVKAGLSPLEAIKAATLNGAKLCRVDQMTGSIEAGKQGDLIAVPGKPDERVEDLRDIRMVVKHGYLVRADLPGFELNRLQMPGGFKFEGGTFAKQFLK